MKIKLQKTQRQKILLTISIGWIIFIGYLTWWNGINSIALDKSFKWDEWFWFGVVPAVAPYLFYNIWKKKDYSVNRVRYSKMLENKF